MKKIIFVLALLPSIIFAQSFVSTIPENKKVVIEQFTGIYCGFCPDGHVIAEGLASQTPIASLRRQP